MVKAVYLVKAEEYKVLKTLDKFSKQMSKMKPCTYSLTNSKNGIIVNISLHEGRLLGELKRRIGHIKDAKFKLIEVKSDPNE
jgi:hypothetical protein